MRLHIFVAAAVVATAFVSARADSISAGTYGGTQIATTGTVTDGSHVNYSESVYADPNNPYCSDCLDFVIDLTVKDSSTTVSIIGDSSFSSYTVSYAYEAVAGDVAPTSVDDSSGMVTFDTSVDHNTSDPLIIYTNATAEGTGTLTINTTGGLTGLAPTGAPHVTPAPTPEPSSLILLGTGLLGAAGILRRRLV